MEIRIPKPNYTAVTVPYSVNLDRTAMWGIEAGLEWTPAPILTVGAAGSWNRYRIINSELGVETLTLYPEITASVYGTITPITRFSIIPRLQYVGNRYADTQGETEIDGYFLVNLKANYELHKNVSISISVENVFDLLYEIRPYFPQPGRSYNVTLTAKY